MTHYPWRKPSLMNSYSSFLSVLIYLHVLVKSDQTILAGLGLHLNPYQQHQCCLEEWNTGS